MLADLFRRIEKRLDRSPSLIVLDEAWQMLSHPVVAAPLVWCLAWRKVCLSGRRQSDRQAKARTALPSQLAQSRPAPCCGQSRADRQYRERSRRLIAVDAMSSLSHGQPSSLRHAISSRSKGGARQGCCPSRTAYVEKLSGIELELRPVNHRKLHHDFSD